MNLNFIVLKLRYIRHIVLRVLALITKRLDTNPSYWTKSVTIYPEFKSDELQRHFLSKLKFAAGGGLQKIEASSYAGGYILLHHFSIKSLLKFFFIWHRVLIVDELYYSTVASDTWTKLAFYLMGSIFDQQVSAQALNAFLASAADKQDAICFVTGPSFDGYKSISLPKNPLKIICNSIVKNDEFLKYIDGPDLLVFADPVFHFGPNDYAAEFRKYVEKTVSIYKPFIAVPDYAYGLIRYHIPACSDRLIGIRCRKSRDWLTPNPERPEVKATANILTLFMMPFAILTSKNIFVLGADGRQKTESYFWQHSKTAQFGDLMQAAFEAHPSFFRDRVYEDYYDKHCESLASQIEMAERLGKSVSSLTESYIPALAKRFKKL